MDISVMTWVVWGLILATYAMMPTMTQKTVIFGVRIPESQHKNSVIGKARRDFLIGTTGVALISVTTTGIFARSLGQNAQGLILIGTTLILLVGNYQVARRRIRARKTAEDWFSGAGHEATAATSLRPIVPLSAWLWWEIAAWAMAIALTIWGIVRYPRIPMRFPIHFNSQGQATAWVQKTPGTVFGVILIVAALILLLTGIVWLVIHRSSPDLDPGNPPDSVWKSTIFRRRMVHSLGIMVVGATTAASIVILMSWGAIGHMNTAIVVAPVLVAVALVLVISWVTGQEGSRLKTAPGKRNPDAVHRDDDKFWKGGLIYYNSDDPKWLVDKRFGVGWTLNFASPVSWTLVVITLAAIILPMLLSK